MDPQIAFVVKEDILRNIIKTHRRVLVAGWQGTGKTVTALKAAGGVADVYYYNELDPCAKTYCEKYNKDAVTLDNLDAAGSMQSGQPLLIIDELDRIGSDSYARVGALLSDSPENVKLLLITRVLLDARDILSKVDVVVRFKQDTAEILMTGLCDLDNI